MKLAARLPLSLNSPRALSAVLAVSVLLAGCNGVSGYTFDTSGSGSSGVGSSGTGTGTSSGSTGTPVPSYTVGGTVTGLATGATGFIIQAGTGNTLPVVSNGRFVFSSGFAPGARYQVAVQTQPGTPTQFCRVSAGTGVISNANVTNVAINCASVGRFLFAANSFDNGGDGTLAAFAIDPTTGRLTAAPGSPYVETMQFQPVDLALDPTGQYLYVANKFSASVSTVGIGTDGALTLDVATASTGASTNSPLSLALDSKGPYLYVGSDDAPAGTVEAYTLAGGVLSPAVGTLAASVYPAGNTPYSIAVDETTGLLLGADLDDGALFDYSIAAGGLLNAVAGSPFAFQQAAPINQPYAVAVYPGARRLYVTDTKANSVSLYSYDALGVPTLSAVYDFGILGGLSPSSVTVDASGSFLFAANSGSGSVSAFVINHTTGTLAPVAGSPFVTTGVASVTPMSVRVDPSSQYVYVSNGDAGSITQFALNFSNGVLTPVGAPVIAILPAGAGGTNGPSAMVIE
jgi:6-phosphogluconolactonase